MYFRSNDFSEAFKRDGQPLNIAALSALRGQSFDQHNDCWIDNDGDRIHIRGVSQHVSIKRYGIVGATTDALMIWERHHNSREAFAYHYEDDPSENGFGS